MKKINFLATLVILVLSIISYQKGAAPDWGLYFLGWGLLAIAEFVSLLRD